MAEDIFVGEYEINASKRILWPYISTASGLAQWFAEDVNIRGDQQYDFLWDDEHHLYVISGQKLNHYIRFTALDDSYQETEEYIELRLDQNELTDTNFLQILDNSGGPGDEELIDLYDTTVHALKEIVGG